MTLNGSRSRQYVKDFNFKPLFIEELGWDRYSSKLDVRVEDHTYNLTAIAEKRGLVVYTCSPMVDGRIPDYAMRLNRDTLSNMMRLRQCTLSHS